MLTRLSARCRIRSLALAVGAMLLALPALADHYILQDGIRREARSIRYQARTREYIIVTEGGSFPIQEAQMREVNVAQPQRWNEAEQMLRSQRYDDAIGVFRDIIRDYTKLNWDHRARVLLAQAYSGKGEHARAISTYEELFREIVPTPAQRSAYWQSLLAAERYATLKTELDGVIAKGSRAEAAAAQLMRGNVHSAEGNTMDALFDYLRTHILFEQVQEVQPEALFRAAERLDDLRDPRAEELRKRLRDLYPRSEYAQRTRSAG